MILKYCESYIIYGIKFNPAQNSLIFNRTTGTVTLKLNNITKWRVRRYKWYYAGVGGLTGWHTEGTFECVLKDGTIFYYPAIMFLSRFENFFEERIQLKPAEYKIYVNPIIFENRKPSLREKIIYQLSTLFL